MYTRDLSKQLFTLIFRQIAAQMAIDVSLGPKPAGCNVGRDLRPYLLGEAHPRWSRELMVMVAVVEIMAP